MPELSYHAYSLSSKVWTSVSWIISLGVMRAIWAIINHVEKSGDLIGRNKILSPVKLCVRDDTRHFPSRQRVGPARLSRTLHETADNAVLLPSDRHKTRVPTSHWILETNHWAIPDNKDTPLLRNDNYVSRDWADLMMYWGNYWG